MPPKCHTGKTAETARVAAFQALSPLFLRCAEGPDVGHQGIDDIRRQLASKGGHVPLALGDGLGEVIVRTALHRGRSQIFDLQRPAGRCTRAVGSVAKDAVVLEYASRIGVGGVGRG